MLSRSAQGLYWMGRYLERAEHLCRLMRLQTEALVDRPVREIYFGWKRIYGAMNRQPPLGEIEIDSDEYTLADSYTLADDLTFERANPDSVWSCFAMGRENARQMRNRISAEMWTRLNLAYLSIQRQDIQEIWRVSPETFYAETAAEIDTFAGVAETTMYRDEGWMFLRLGRVIERSQLLVALLLFQVEAETEIGEDSDTDWTTLLRAYHAFEAYNRKYSVEVQSAQVLDLLVADPLLPGSLSRTLDVVEENLASLGPGSDERSGGEARRLAGKMAALVHYDWPDEQDREKLLKRMRDHCRELHGLVTSAYFEYAVEDFPVR